MATLSEVKDGKVVLIPAVKVETRGTNGQAIVWMRGVGGTGRWQVPGTAEVLDPDDEFDAQAFLEDGFALLAPRVEE